MREVLCGEDVFSMPTVQIVQQQTGRGESAVELLQGGDRSAQSELGVMPYGEFLKRLNRQTDLPLSLLHRSIAEARDGMDTPHRLFNIASLAKIVKAFEMKFAELFAQRFSYRALDFTARTNIFADDGQFVAELAQGLVGTEEARDITRDKSTHLYDRYLYDSEPEHEILRVDPPAKVVVYGKLPRRSVMLPTYTGGTTSPDFVYAIRRESPDDIALHFVVETKSDNPRLSDIRAVEAQRKAFEQIAGNIHWKMETDAAEFERDLNELVNRPCAGR